MDPILELERRLDELLELMNNVESYFNTINNQINIVRRNINTAKLNNGIRFMEIDGPVRQQRNPARELITVQENEETSFVVLNEVESELFSIANSSTSDIQQDNSNAAIISPTLSIEYTQDLVVVYDSQIDNHEPIGTFFGYNYWINFLLFYLFGVFIMVVWFF
ncbi:uncharacterized protein RJT21DRAFT_112035 [Scheffersomyces amazonensis]|uniref:uncharacterized protein n=1 Tax=Scheffersomyces amazonensis TaxID=1078765 RepID=UPI00315C5E48